MTLYDKFMALQQQVVDLLEAVPELKDYPVSAEVKGDLSSQIEDALNKMGLSIVVLTPSSKILHRNGGRIVRKVTLLIGVYETAILNRNGKNDLTALKAATLATEALAYADNGFEPDLFDDEETGRFELGDEDISLLEDERTSQLIYMTTIQTVISN